MDSPGAKTQHGYLVLADISGYTSFVAGTELEHAHEILSELLELIVDRFKTLLTISKLEGDAVFTYAAEAKLPRGELLLELIEATYFAFRDRVEGIRRRTTCQCNACRAIPTLDLKFIVHYGHYIVQQVSGIKELVGSDVNLIHRLLKNHVAEVTGWRAYALFTGISLEHIGLKVEGLHSQTEAYEHLGQVQTHSLNLHARYQMMAEDRRAFVTAEEADVALRHEFAAPPPVIWDWLNDPHKRTQWMVGRTWSAGLRPAGRTGVGARNHCAHGKNTIVETILDWRPFDYVTVEQMVNNAVMTETVCLELLPDGRGTRLHDHIRFATPLPRWLRRPLVRWIVTTLAKYKSEEIFEGLARHVAREQAAEAEMTPPAEALSAPVATG